MGSSVEVSEFCFATASPDLVLLYPSVCVCCTLLTLLQPHRASLSGVRKYDPSLPPLGDVAERRKQV